MFYVGLTVTTKQKPIADTEDKEINDTTEKSPIL